MRLLYAWRLPALGVPLPTSAPKRAMPQPCGPQGGRRHCSLLSIRLACRQSCKAANHCCALRDFCGSDPSACSRSRLLTSQWAALLAVVERCG